MAPATIGPFQGRFWAKKGSTQKFHNGKDHNQRGDHDGHHLNRYHTRPLYIVFDEYGLLSTNDIITC